jgi:hypothetical protein
MRPWAVLTPFLWAALVCCPPDGVAVETSSSEILTSPGRFDGQAVTLTGVVANVRKRWSRDGNPRYQFELSDGKRPITVLAGGKFTCHAGDPVVVDGRFQRVKREGRYTFFNEVEAMTIGCRS